MNQTANKRPGKSVKDTGDAKYGKDMRTKVISWMTACVGSGLLFAGIYAAVGAQSGGAVTTKKLEFNRDIRPILSENCYACHGPDKGARKGKFRLDVRNEALGKGAFKPGDADKSELVKRINTTNADDMMPPPDSNKHLTQAQKDMLKRWIAEGAEYEPHWAYIKPVRPEIPETKNAKWVRNPIDAFVLHDLEAQNMHPSKEAPKNVLLRRLSLDLIGLPPTPAELDAFMKDKSPKAYERQVDRLLKSPHYGEQMAVHWLDLARFADTVGYHGDQNINDFPYRDYVINAYNNNKPFDQFTIEQLAGDLLPRPTTEQLVASGFNRLNMVTREGGAQPGEYIAKYGADRVRTVATTWLGSTMGCCECHDHKFDPFSTKDFYSMKAFFADIKQWGVYAEYSYTPNPDLRGVGNDHPFPPEIRVDSPYLHKRLDRVDERIAEWENNSMKKVNASKESRKAFEAWRDWSKDFLKQNPDGWVVLKPETNNEPDEAKEQFTEEPDGEILFNAKSKEATELTLPLKAGWIAAVRLELVPRKEHDNGILMGKVKNDSAMVTLGASIKSPGKDKEVPISFYYADADHKEKRYSNGHEIIGVQDQWKTEMAAEKQRQTAVYLINEPVKAKDGDVLNVKLARNLIGCVRVSVTPFAAEGALKSGAGEMAGLLKGRRKDAEKLGLTYLLSAKPDTEAFADYKKMENEALGYWGGKSPTVVTVAWKPVETRVLHRGNWQDMTGDVVLPEVPHFLPQPPDADGHRLTRLDLAKWIVSPDNPLTARTVMNRMWKRFFGNGISTVVDDLGAQGEWPVHPELLDWLAVEFRESGWDTKHMVKLMVMSSTYRQSSDPTPEMHERDPLNRMLASQSPRRLEAEFVRDNALYIAGLLNEDIGGPSAFPYQPAGYYANIQFPNRDYDANTDDRQYRRGVYTHWQRTFLQPMLANFDAPSRDECTAIRNVSNSPQQILTVLNDPTFVEAARMFAGRVLMAAPKTDDQRLKLIYKEALARPVKGDEEKSLEDFLKSQRDYYDAHRDDAEKLMHVGLATEPKATNDAELAAWTQVCRVVLGLHETITKY
jgi:hypothetical protein